jgi:monoamine oxidase
MAATVYPCVAGAPLRCITDERTTVQNVNAMIRYRQDSARQPRTPGMAAARRTFALHRQSERSGLPVDEIVGRLEQARAAGALRTRRELIVGGAAAAAAAALAAHPAAGLARALRERPQPRIAIVGAGLAGLRCAHLLFNSRPERPILASVYEANAERAGGRCWSLRDYFAEGLITEHGGQLINTPQKAVRRLARLLGLQEEVVNGGNLPQGEEVFFIGGALYRLPEADADWKRIGYQTFRAAGLESETPAGAARLDAMSVPEWLDSTEIGTGSRFGKLMLANTVTENGGDPADQSALDLIVLLAGSPLKSIVPLGGDDERFHIVGGNDQLVSRMIEQLPPETVQHGHVLVAARAGSDETVTLTFEVDGSLSDVVADFVVFALPFSTLRDVELGRSGLSQTKRTVIKTMGMGTNAKVHLELTHKTWPALGYSGATYGEWDRLACAWDDCVPLGADATPALFVAFPGGRVGASGLTGAAHGPAPAADANWALSEIDNVFPGTSAAYTGRAYEDHWALDPWVKGAYSYYRVGQARSYQVLAQAPEGPYLFAGEQTSSEIGFLDGAVESGEEAAKALRRRVR